MHTVPGNGRDPDVRGLLGLAALLVVSGCASSAPHQPPTPGRGGTVVFFDDFAGPTLDRSKWNVEVTGWTKNDEQQAYIDDPETVRIARPGEADGAANGALVLQARFRPGVLTTRGEKFDFVSGHIDTRGKVEVTYGTIAARIKLAPGPGLWPAFWVLGTGEWPATGEIDVMEYVGEPDWTSVALHGPGYSGDTPLFNRLYLPPNDDVTQWHVYSVDWTPDTLLFHVDDAVVYRATRPMIENYGRWSYDNPKFLILNLALGGAYPVKTNGVRVPYPGMPAATVEAIKAGRGTMLVDWVRVTRR
jgi:beta-glucanase (GH16 family)